MRTCGADAVYRCDSADILLEKVCIRCYKMI